MLFTSQSYFSIVLLVMLKLGIRTKILFLILAATILPLVSLNFFWSNSQRQDLHGDARTQQALVTRNDANDVNNFIVAKIRTLIIHSQNESLQQFTDLNKASLEIGTLLYQDKDITRAALVNQGGDEIVALTSDLKKSTLQNVKNSAAFQVVNFYAGNEYISPVSTDTHGTPFVTIAVPLVTFTKPQDLNDLSTAEAGVVRNPQDIKGALIAQISLANLWNSVLSSTGAGPTASPDAYAYVVDDKGVIIAHPDTSLNTSHKDASNIPIVALFKNSIGSTTITGSMQGMSEKGVQTIASFERIPSTNWGVIYQQPVGSLYASLNHVTYLGLAIAGVAIVVMFWLSFWLSRFITKPILSIAAAAERIGRGQFSEKIAMKRSDEIGQLSVSVNTMGHNLQSYIQRVDAQRRQLEIILNSTTDSILALDVNGVILIANRVTGTLAELDTKLLVGKDIRDVFTWKRNLQDVAIAYDSAGTETYNDLTYTSPSGTIHYVNLVSVGVATTNAAVQTIITIHDETKSRELEDMKLDFVSMAAHELRTPLSAIRGYLELMAIQPKEAMNDAIRHYTQQARTSAVTLSSLISNLLDVSRIERGTLVLSMEKVDLASIVALSVEGLQMNAANKHITLSYSGAPDNEYIVGDKVAIREVIDNLCDNAIKYTQQGGSVAVNLVSVDDSYVLSIKDTGIGIPANALPYLFTKFYRVHGGLESGSTGTGLGLFISKSIVERHSGTITVQSKIGSGTEFRVSIPKYSDQRSLELQKGNQSKNAGTRRGWSTKNTTR